MGSLNESSEGIADRVESNEEKGSADNLGNFDGAPASTSFVEGESGSDKNIAAMEGTANKDSHEYTETETSPNGRDISREPPIPIVDQESDDAEFDWGDLTATEVIVPTADVHVSEEAKNKMDVKDSDEDEFGDFAAENSDGDDFEGFQSASSAVAIEPSPTVPVDKNAARKMLSNQASEIIIKHFQGKILVSHLAPVTSLEGPKAAQAAVEILLASKFSKLKSSYGNPCHRCGAPELFPGASFCSVCGTTFPRQPSKCDALLTQDLLQKRIFGISEGSPSEFDTICESFSSSLLEADQDVVVRQLLSDAHMQRSPYKATVTTGGREVANKDNGTEDLLNIMSSEPMESVARQESTESLFSLPSADAGKSATPAMLDDLLGLDFTVEPNVPLSPSPPMVSASPELFSDKNFTDSPQISDESGSDGNIGDSSNDNALMNTNTPGNFATATGDQSPKDVDAKLNFEDASHITTVLKDREGDNWGEFTDDTTASAEVINTQVEEVITPDEVASKIEEEESNQDEDDWGEFAGDATVDTEGINAEVEGSVTPDEAASKIEEEKSNNDEDNWGEFAGEAPTDADTMNAEVEVAVTPDEVASKIEEEESNNDEDNWGEFAGDDATVDTEGINAEVEGAVTLNEAAPKTEEEESNNDEDNWGEFAGEVPTDAETMNTEIEGVVTPDEAASKIEEEESNQDEDNWGEFAGDATVDTEGINAEVEGSVTPDEAASKIEEEKSNNDEDNWGEFAGEAPTDADTMNAEVEVAVTPDEVASKIEEEESNNDEDNWGEFAGDDATVDTEGINAEVEGAVTLNEAAPKTEEEESNNDEDNWGEFAGDDATAGTKVINTEVDEGVTPDEVASKIEEEHNNDEEDWGEFAGDDKVPVNTEVEEAVTLMK